MGKVLEILRQEHPEALVFLANYQWKHFSTKLDFLIPERHPEAAVVITPSFPSLAAITVTMREKPSQKRGRGW